MIRFVRLFVAIFPPKPVLDHWAAARDRAASVPRARWISAESLHITLAFLGSIADDRAPRVAAALGAVAQRPAFSLGFSSAGAFPSDKRPRVYWLGVAGDRPGLVSLAGDVADALRTRGFPLEDRAFHPHLTVARVAGPGPQPGFGTLFRDYKSPMFDVSAFHLVRSHLGSSAARYEILANFPLSPSPL